MLACHLKRHVYDSFRISRSSKLLQDLKKQAADIAKDTSKKGKKYTDSSQKEALKQLQSSQGYASKQLESVKKEADAQYKSAKVGCLFKPLPLQMLTQLAVHPVSNLPHLSQLHDQSYKYSVQGQSLAREEF